MMLQPEHGLVSMPSRLVHQQLTPQDFVNIHTRTKVHKVETCCTPKTMHMYQIHK